VTDFSKKVQILGSFYANYGQDPEYKDFVEFNDLGLPLAYLSGEGLCELSADGEKFIEETWTHFVKSLGIEDTGFENIDEMFQASLDGS
jgi:hypothetical protein